MVVTENATCVGGPLDASACDLDSDCRVCEGGPNDRQPCVGVTDCPEGDCPEASTVFCIGDSVCREVVEAECPGPSPWAEGGICGAQCVGGAFDGGTCTQQFDCPPACIGGARAGDPCFQDAECPGLCEPGGVLSGNPCLSRSDCIAFPGDSTDCVDELNCGPSGTCYLSYCTGGTTEGAPCLTSSDCDGGGECPGPFAFDCGVAACCVSGDTCLNLTERECAMYEPLSADRAYRPGVYCLGEDCQPNGTPDGCDIVSGDSIDCTSNSIPDECEPDCNSNGVADSCDIHSSASNDCDENGVPDECQVDCDGDGTIDRCETPVASILFSEDFENGLPTDWSATGLWHTTDQCALNVECNPKTWAYFGDDYSCQVFGDRAQGTLTSPGITIPSNAIEATLTYCSRYDMYFGSGTPQNAPTLSANDFVLENDFKSAGSSPFPGGGRTIDLLAFAGSTVHLKWEFLSQRYDGSSWGLSGFGWQIDDVQILIVTTPFPDCNENQLSDACEPDCDANGSPDSCDLVARPVLQTDIDDPLTDLFGSSVATNGQTVLMGQPETMGTGTGFDTLWSAGAVQVYQLSDGAMGLVDELRASDPEQGAGFGTAVAMDGDIAVIGIKSTSASLGSAYVFRSIDGSWSEEAKLNTRDGFQSDGFGLHVSASGDAVAVAAPGDSAAYVFRLVAGRWEQEAKLVAPDASPADEFAVALSISGDTLVVGAPGVLPGGTVYVFERSLGKWSLTASIEGTGRFGTAVDVDDDLLIVGAPDDRFDQGAEATASIYRRTSESWVLETTLHELVDDQSISFSSSVAIDGDTAVIAGSGFDDFQLRSVGLAHIYRRVSGAWVRVDSLRSHLDFNGGSPALVAARGNLVVTSDTNPQYGTGFVYFLATQIDTDGDGIGNVCDPCTDSDGDGFADPGFVDDICPPDICPGFDDNIDSDLDGIPDGCDICPLPGIEDTDGDTLCDDVDNCVDHFNADQADCDHDGVGDVCQIALCPPDDPACGDCDASGVPDACEHNPIGYENRNDLGEFFTSQPNHLFMADDIQLNGFDCNMIAWEVRFRGEGATTAGAVQAALHTQLDDDDPERGGRIAVSRVMDIISGTNIKTLRKDFSPPIPLSQQELWVVYKMQNAFVGPLATCQPATIGATDDAYFVHDGSTWVVRDLGPGCLAAFDVTIYCETASDCNANGTIDACDIDALTSPDCNVDGVPDECRLGDIDGDDEIGLPDHVGFTNCMTGPCGGAACTLAPNAPACCSIMDFDGNGSIDLFDAAAFQRKFGKGN